MSDSKEFHDLMQCDLIEFKPYLVVELVGLLIVPAVWPRVGRACEKSIPRISITEGGMWSG